MTEYRPSRRIERMTKALTSAFAVASIVVGCSGGSGDAGSAPSAAGFDAIRLDRRGCRSDDHRTHLGDLDDRAPRRRR